MIRSLLFLLIAPLATSDGPFVSKGTVEDAVTSSDSYYARLGLCNTTAADTRGCSSVTQKQIKKAYLKLSMVWHPDKNLNNIDEATDTMSRIAKAHTVLSVEADRKYYDEHGIAKADEEKEDGGQKFFAFSKAFMGPLESEGMTREPGNNYGAFHNFENGKMYLWSDLEDGADRFLAMIDKPCENDRDVSEQLEDDGPMLDCLGEKHRRRLLAVCQVACKVP